MRGRRRTATWKPNAVRFWLRAERRAGELLAEMEKNQGAVRRQDRLQGKTGLRH